MKSLVVYYSRTGNTRFVAELVAKHLGADIEEVIDHKNRKGILGWLSAGKDARLRKETQISPSEHDPCNYELIVVGSPVWGGSLTPAIRTYLRKHDLSGKKVAIFNTNMLNERINTFKEIKELINQEPVSQAVFSRVSMNMKRIEENVKTWCGGLNKLAQR